MKYASELLTLYAGILLLAGAALLFAPEEIGAAIMPDLLQSQEVATTRALFVQLLGAAFIGFAASDWIARHSPVGGIYGR